MSRIRISIQSDGLAATVAADPGPAATKADVLLALQQASVVHGIDDDAVTQFARGLADPGQLAAVVVARGRPAEPGVPGCIERTFPAGTLVGRLHADGHIDYHERELLHPVAIGDVIGRIVAPTSGVPGCDVRGRTLVAKPGKPHAVRFGPGVQVKADEVLGARQGVVLQDARQIDVVPLYQHGGDVDLRSGNLHSEGSLVVRGDVQSGFTVAAGGDIVVGGAVQHGTVTAGGSVRIDGGVLEGSAVHADGSIRCRHVTSARLDAGLDLDLLDQATHAHVRAEHIRIDQGRGTAFGGELRARGSISLQHAGTKIGADTLLSVGDLIVENASLVRTGNRDSKIERSAARARRDSPGPAGKANRALMKGSDQAQQQRLTLLQRQRTLLATATIRVAGTAHAGVRIQFGSQTLSITEPRARIRFRWDPQHNKILEENLP